MKAPKIDGTATGELMVQDDAGQYNSPEILAKTAERLKAMGGNPAPVIESKSQETDESDDSTLTTETEEDGAVGTTDGDNDVSTDDNDTNEGDDNKDEIVIPEKLYRAATHNGWEAEKISAFWKLDPELAQQTLEKMHKDQVSVNTQYVEQGRAAKQLAADREALEQQRVVSVVEPVKPKGFVDVEAYKAEHGDAAAVVVEQMNNALIELSQRQTQAQTQMQTQTQQDQGTRETGVAKREQSLALVQQMSQWFADPALAPYKEFYGAGVDENGFPLITNDHLTLDQQVNREKLINKAHDWDAGIRLRGGTASIAEALQSAHTIITDSVKTEMVRKDIMSKAKKRANGVTLRASSKKITPAVTLKPGQKMTDKQLEDVTEKRIVNMIAHKPLDG